MAAPSIVVTPANSPYKIDGPTANYAEIQLTDGGFLEIAAPTELSVESLEKKAQGQHSMTAINPVPPRASRKDQR